MRIGYARVSTKQQGESLDQQIANLKKANCEEVYSEVVSGANSKRKELTRLLSKIQSGDILIMCAGHDVRAKGLSPSWADIERSIS